MITFLIKGSPAQEAGLKAGDIIVAVNDMPTEKLSVEEVRNLLLGEKGTTVKVTVAKPSNMNVKKDFYLTRREIKYSEANQGESPNFSGPKLEIKIGSIESPTAPYPYGNEIDRKLAVINLSAPGATSYEAYILNKERKPIARVYIDDGEYLGSGLETQAQWVETISSDPAENVNSPTGKYIFFIKCYGSNNQVASAEKEFQIDVTPPILKLSSPGKIISDGQLIFAANKDVYVNIATYDKYGNTIEVISNGDKIYTANRAHKLKLARKDKIGYVWLKVTDRYGNTSAKVIGLASAFSEEVKKYYLYRIAGSVSRKAWKNKEYTNYYNEILLKSRELLNAGAPLKAILLLQACEEKYPYEDVISDYSYIKGGFGAMAQMEIARIYAEHLNDYEQAITEYSKAIKKYKGIEIGFIQAPRGPWGKCGIFSLLKIARIYGNDLKDYKKALDVYHSYLGTYADEWEGVWEYAYSFDLQALNSIINITKTIYGNGDKTIEECKKIIAEARNEDMACEALIKIAEVYEEKTNYSEAINSYAEIINRYPTAEITFPYDVPLNYSSLAKIKILNLYQKKLKNPSKTKEYAETIINTEKDQAIIDLAHKKLDELLPADKRNVNEIKLEYKLPKYAEHFHLDQIIGEDENKLFFAGGYDDQNFTYSLNIKDALKETIRDQQKDEIKKFIFTEEANVVNADKKAEYELIRNENIHKIVKQKDKQIVYTSIASVEPVISFVSDKNHLYILHPNHVIIRNVSDFKERKLSLSNRKYDWPKGLWISPDSHCLIVWDEGRLVNNTNEENTLKVINLEQNSEKVVHTVTVKGEIKNLLFLDDNKHFLINKGRAPYCYYYQDYIPSKIDIYELSTMKNIKTIYVDGDAMNVVLSKNKDYLWILSNRHQPILSIVDVNRILK